MLSHLRANLWLLVLTLLLCSVAYPLVLLGIGQTLFHDKAQGSLLYDASGKAIGSRLIGQPFTDKDGNALEEYFQPRPSAVSYKADASGASNWAASNYKLRERVARALGPIVKYGPQHPKHGQPVGPDVEAWFQRDRYDGKPAIVAQWARAHPDSAKAWLQGDANKLQADHVAAWAKDHPAEVAAWVKEHPQTPEPKPEDLAVAFFESHAAAHPGTWPAAVDGKAPDGKTEKQIQPVKEGSDIQSVFFDMWRQEHPDVDLEPVPADMVMASGSGLDPHITLQNARYQLPGVVDGWAKKTNGDKEKIRAAIEGILKEKTEAPLGGLVGVDMVNALEVNLALKGLAENNWRR